MEPNVIDVVSQILCVVWLSEPRGNFTPRVEAPISTSKGKGVEHPRMRPRPLFVLCRVLRHPKDPSTNMKIHASMCVYVSIYIHRYLCTYLYTYTHIALWLLQGNCYSGLRQVLLEAVDPLGTAILYASCPAEANMA